MTTTQAEYVLDVEHESDCPRRGDRSALFLRREIAESMDAYFASDEDGEYISADGRWTFEESLEPLELGCTGCSATRYVATDRDMNVVALTRENCPRSTFNLGHYGQGPCKYCGYTRKALA